MLDQGTFKSFDCRGRGGFAQAEVRSYCDCMDMVLLTRGVVAMGVRPSLVATMVRIQYLPAVSVTLGGLARRRTRGSFTGCWVAGAAADMQPPLLIAVNVDNVYRASRSGGGVVQVLRQLGEELGR